MTVILRDVRLMQYLCFPYLIRYRTMALNRTLLKGKFEDGVKENINEMHKVNIKYKM
jgi:hypothetical protein